MAITRTYVFLLRGEKMGWRYILLLLKPKSKFCPASEQKYIDLSSYEFTYDLHKVCEFHLKFHYH